MPHSRRQSLSSSWIDQSGPPGPVTAPIADSEVWVKEWSTMLARDLIDSKIVSVDADTSVEDACDKLLSEEIGCLVVTSTDSGQTSYIGLFDFSDVNAFLTLAATRHTLNQGDLTDSGSRANEIITAAKAGHVPVRLVSNLSQKNPLETLPYDATVLSLLKLFSRGIHRVLISTSPSSSNQYTGLVSDRGLLSYFASNAIQTPPLLNYLNNPLHFFPLPSLHIYADVIAASAEQPLLDVMKLMSEEGVSSVAVTDDSAGSLLSAISVTDIGKIVVPSGSKQILYMPLHQFIALIKEPDGSTDGEDRYPIYSVSHSNRLSYAIDKLLATNAHRLFVTTEPAPLSESQGLLPATQASTRVLGPKLSGIVSIVDILTVFAQLAGVTGIDPTRMQRHRRASSSSTSSSKSERDAMRMSISGSGIAVPGRSSSSRSSSRSSGSYGRSGSFVLPTVPSVRPGTTAEPIFDGSIEKRGTRHSVAGIEGVLKVAIGTSPNT